VAHVSVAQGVVKPVLEEYSLPSQEIHAVFPSPKLVPPKVSRFIAFAQQHFPQQWWVQQESPDLDARMTDS
jgi:DNA-binding transcriptional LysR family regulator